MAKISKPKSAPAIDMTPMVDLAFLLVTFFMLSANFRTDEVVQVDTPSSISEMTMPENVVLITVDQGGRVYFGISGKEEAKQNLLKRMSEKYKVPFSPEQITTFGSLTDFGCTIQEMPAFLNMSSEERKRFVAEGKTMAIPTDSTNNQLKDWINFGNIEMLAVGEKAYFDAKDRGLEPNINEFKPKFVLKVDGKAEYLYAKKVIETFRDLKLSNLNFITSLEADPRKPQ
ncbi:MAG: biopolymer transporter ExbD [Crocinitomicaceae bacterium]|nr:biopolymer transporter ExbD [Crocinitomicaceae bacterium]